MLSEEEMGLAEEHISSFNFPPVVLAKEKKAKRIRWNLSLPRARIKFATPSQEHPGIGDEKVVKFPLPLRELWSSLCHVSIRHVQPGSPCRQPYTEFK